MDVWYTSDMASKNFGTKCIYSDKMQNLEIRHYHISEKCFYLNNILFTNEWDWAAGAYLALSLHQCKNGCGNKNK